MNIFVMASFLSGSLLPPNLPENEAIKLLAPYFSPALGTQIHVDQFEVQNIKKDQDPMALRGFIEVDPPKGRCFIIQKHHDLPDVTVCKKEVLSFQMRELDVAGQLHWRVFTGKDDYGTDVSWKSPHRLAQFIPIGQFKTMLGKYVPVLSCEPLRREGRRSVLLTLMTGEPWLVHFPDNDKLTKQPDDTPNLFIRVGKKKPIEEAKPPEGAHGEAPKESGHGEASKQEAHGEAPKESAHGEAPKEGAHAEASKETAKPEAGGHGEPEKKDEKPTEGAGQPKTGLGSGKKVEEEPGYPWNVHPRGAYEMSSAQFITEGAPFGLKGMCRYKFSGAPGDPEAGILECQDADRYDALLVHLPCSGGLGPNP
jgi:hypothetical protein